MRHVLTTLALGALACSSGGASAWNGAADGATPFEPTAGAPARHGAGAEDAAPVEAAVGGTGGFGATGGSTAGAGASVSASGGSAGAATPVSNGVSISCGGAPCQAPAQHCCITGEGSGNPPSFQCIPVSVGCGLNALERMCDASEDCGPGRVCCADTTHASTPSKCRAECLSGEQRACWSGGECAPTGGFCCFFPSRPAGFCMEAAHPGANLCVG